MQPAVRSWALRLGMVLLSTSIAVVLGLWLMREFERPRPTVRTEDQSEILRELHRERDLRSPDPDPAESATSAGYPKLRREPLDAEQLGMFFPASRSSAPGRGDLYYAREPGLDLRLKFPEHPEGGYRLKTNSLGMREDEEPRQSGVDLRLLVTGDSHIDGVCANEESVPNILERLIRAREGQSVVEVLNVGAGGYSFYNYLNVLESYADLEPDVFVCVCYGGNDFAGMMQLQRYFNGRPTAVPRSQHGPQVVAELTAPGLTSQELSQVIYFQDNPEDFDAALATCGSIAVEMRELCERRGIRLVFAYLPPHLRGQPQHYVTELRQCHELLEVDDTWIEVSDRLADRWLENSRALGIECIDLRPALKAAPQPAYYRSDRHLNPYGNRVVAQALFDECFAAPRVSTK
jgi:lysophospholipase L1-like esterase